MAAGESKHNSEGVLELCEKSVALFSPRCPSSCSEHWVSLPASIPQVQSSTPKLRFHVLISHGRPWKELLS
jgi:hypothetical protein